MVQEMDDDSRNFFGYWRGPRAMAYASGGDSDLPDPRDYIDESWDPTLREQIVERLSLGAAYARWMGYSSCRICGCLNGTKCFTLDGTWVWPEGFSHYVEEHGVRPPQEMVDHLLGIHEALLDEMRLYHKTVEDRVTEYQSEMYTRCEGPCETEVRDYHKPGEFQCTIRHGSGGSMGGPGCQRRSRKLQDDLDVERKRHAEALGGLVKKPWDGGIFWVADR